MSVQALGWVLDHSPTRGADRLVLISIANHAGREPTDDGAWEAWPGVELIRREAGLGRARSVPDIVTRLANAGALERVVNGAPDERIRKDQRPNLYRILMDHGVSCGVTRCSWCGVTRDAERGDASRQDGVTRDDRTGCRAASPEPSLEPSGEPEEQPLPGVADATPAPIDKLADAKAIVDPWWEERRDAGNPVGQPYIACVKVVDRMLRNQVTERRIAFALRAAPTCSTGALEMAIQQELQRRGERATPERLTPRMQRLMARPDGLRRFAEAAGFDIDDPDNPLALPPGGDP